VYTCTHAHPYCGLGAEAPTVEIGMQRTFTGALTCAEKADRIRDSGRAWFEAARSHRAATQKDKGKGKLDGLQCI